MIARNFGMAAVCAAACFAALAQPAPVAPGASPAPGNQPDPVVVLVPLEIHNPALDAGCWAQLYDERDFKGDVVTIVGPMQLDSLDRSTGRHLRRSIDSVVLGPKARLVVYEHRMFKDRSVTFEPNSREAGVLRKIGATGRIESLQLNCTS